MFDPDLIVPDKSNIWKSLAAPLPTVTANSVRERLDSVVAGEWDSTLDSLPSKNDVGASFKCRIQILGVIREGVGSAATYKDAASDAFIESARLFGIGAGNDSTAPAAPARPARDPRAKPEAVAARLAESAPAAAPSAPAPAGAYPDGFDPENPTCPKCGGKCWDNRVGKKNPKSPDFRCRDKDNCDGVIWPPKAGSNSTPHAAKAVRSESDPFYGAPPDEPDDLNFDDESGIPF